MLQQFHWDFEAFCPLKIRYGMLVFSILEEVLIEANKLECKFVYSWTREVVAFYRFRCGQKSIAQKNMLSVVIGYLKKGYVPAAVVSAVPLYYLCSVSRHENRRPKWTLLSGHVILWGYITYTDLFNFIPRKIPERIEKRMFTDCKVSHVAFCVRLYDRYNLFTLSDDIIKRHKTWALSHRSSIPSFSRAKLAPTNCVADQWCRKLETVVSRASTTLRNILQYYQSKLDN